MEPFGGTPLAWIHMIALLRVKYGAIRGYPPRLDPYDRTFESQAWSHSGVPPFKWFQFLSEIGGSIGTKSGYSSKWFQFLSEIGG